MLRRLGQTLARLVGLAFAILGAWVFAINLGELAYSGWVLFWVLTSGLAGAVGGLVFLLSFDGPPRFHSARVRLLGWVGMLFFAVLPSSLSWPLLAMVLLTIPTLIPIRQATGPARTD